MIDWRLLLLFTAVLFGCEEPNVRVERLDPAIQASFIDVDSLLTMDAMITGINDEISMVNDSLAVIDSLEIAGDPTDYSDLIDELNASKTALQEERTEITNQRSRIAGGTLLIDKITAAGSDKELVFSEPSSTYRLPLNAFASSTELFIQYNGEINRVRFNYNTDTVLVDRTVRILAKELSLSSFDYDSARLSCDTIECSSVNAKAVFYM